MRSSPRSRPLLHTCLALVWLLLGASGNAALATPEDARAPLTSVAALRRLLPDEAARQIPIRIQAVVVYINPVVLSDLVVVQDGVGIYVDTTADQKPVRPGDLLEISGITAPGKYAPTVAARQVTVLGRGTLPEAIPASVGDLAAGAQDSQWVQVSGIVRAARIESSLEPERLILDIATSSGRVSAYVIGFAKSDVERLVDASVSLRGACFHYFNSRRQAFNFRLVCNSVTDDVTIDHPPEAPAFSLAIVKAASLLQFRPEGTTPHRVRVRGTITYLRPGEMLVIADETGSVVVRTSQRIAGAVGTMADVAGFATMRELSPVLEDSVVRTGGFGSLPEPKAIRAAEALSGDHDAGLVRLEGEIQDIVSYNDETTLLLRAASTLFQARLTSTEKLTALPYLTPGARVSVTGICAVQLGDRGRFTQGGKPESFRLLLRTPADVQLLQTAPWWTSRRMLWALAATSAVLLLAMTWALTLRRKNASLHEQVEARKSAEASLRKLHADLERRVEDRTRQLREEISVRHETEAVLDERNRLASELHDTLEQGLTGIALQLEAAARGGELAATPRRHVELARTMIHQSQAEVRRSVWNLRSQLLDEHSLAEAIRISVEGLFSGTKPAFRFEQSGEAVDLPEVIESNLLRLAQEAVTNVLKHAQASTVRVCLVYEAEQLRLVIEDDGCGFEEAALPTPKDGHFGLFGMRERVKRIGGKLQITGRTGLGTTIEATVPYSSSFALCRKESL